MENMPRDYGGIIGCDLSGKVRTKIYIKGKRWVVQMGRRRYRCKIFINEDKGSIGLIKRTEHWIQKKKETIYGYFY